MSKNCPKHQCFKKSKCENQIFLGCLIMCDLAKIGCRHCAPNPYGRYEPEDVIKF